MEALMILAKNNAVISVVDKAQGLVPDGLGLNSGSTTSRLSGLNKSG